MAKSSIKRSSTERLQRLLVTKPSWMRQAKGTAKQVPRPSTSNAMAWQEWPMMYSALELDWESWCRSLTAGILRPSLGRLIPSATSTRRPPTRTSQGRNNRRATPVQTTINRSKGSACE